MRRLRITYNGITSEVNAYESGKGKTVCNGKVVSNWAKYSVRPSKTNRMQISGVIEHHSENGMVEWHLYTRIRIPRGYKVEVE